MLSFPLARNVSDDIAYSFTEEEYQYFAVGAIVRKPDGRAMPFGEVGILDLRQWERNMPEYDDVPGTVAEALELNGCETTAENADTMARAARGLLEGHNPVELTRNPKAKEAPDDHWHQGMLDCLDTTTLSTVTTAYEKASK